MARRGRNEGHIRQRSDGRWEARVDLGYEGPTRRRKSIYGRTREEVADKLVEIQQRVRRGLPVLDERERLGPFLEDWLESSVKPSVRYSTWKTYDMYARLHIIPALGKRPLVKLTPQEVQRFFNKKLEEGLTPRTVEQIRAILRRALGQAEKWGMVSRNVAALTSRPKVQRKRISPLDPDQARTFLDSLNGDRFDALFVLALSTGLRQGEALGLRWGDIDFETATVHVSGALQRVEGKLTRVEPKTNNSRRSIGLPPVAADALRAHRTRQIEWRLAAGETWQDTGYVFTSYIGTPVDASAVIKAFKKVLERAGLPDIRFQDLRHSCASLLMAQGMHPRVVMETLGHSQISLTMDTYSHVSAALQREAADAIDAILQ